MSEIPDKYYRVSSKAIVTDGQGKLLLVKERSDDWSIPGGALDHGEDLITGVKRELREELGVSTQEVEPRPLYAWPSHHSKFDDWCFTVCYRVVLEPGDLFNFGDGVTEAQYFSAEELKSLKLDEADRPIASLFK